MSEPLDTSHLAHLLIEQHGARAAAEAARQVRAAQAIGDESASAAWLAILDAVLDAEQRAADLAAFADEAADFPDGIA